MLGWVTAAAALRRVLTPRVAPPSLTGTCHTCAFYRDRTCHRHAPTVSGGFPYVLSTDSCGEHTPRKDTP